MSSTLHPTSETADAAAPMILDLDHLRRQTLGDGALEAELLALFSHQARSILKELNSPAAALPGRADLLHLLCGSARAVGAWEVALHAERLESQARGTASPHWSAAGLPALAHAVQRACEAIDRRRATSPDPRLPRPAATRR